MPRIPSTGRACDGRVELARSTEQRVVVALAAVMEGDDVMRGAVDDACDRPACLPRERSEGSESEPADGGTTLHGGYDVEPRVQGGQVPNHRADHREVVR